MKKYFELKRKIEELIKKGDSDAIMRLITFSNARQANKGRKLLGRQKQFLDSIRQAFPKLKEVSDSDLSALLAKGGNKETIKKLEEMGIEITNRDKIKKQWQLFS